MKQGDILDKKIVELGGKKFLAYLKVCEMHTLGNPDRLFICPKISPFNKVKEDPLAEYPKLKEKE